MNPLPPLELLEATHDFPGKFLFKAIGRHDDRFIADVVAAVREGLQQDFDPPYELKLSAHGRHVSIAVEPCVDSAELVLVIYQRLRSVDGLALLL